MDSCKVLPIPESDKLLLEYNPAGNASVPFMTRFEKAAVLGVRLQQLYKGAPSVLSPGERAPLATLEEVVDAELRLRKMPLMIVRTMPDGKKELWKLDDFLVF